MVVSLIKIKYVPAEPAELGQGYKNNKVPDFAVAGGNGSYIVLGKPNKVIMTVMNLESEAHEEIEFNVRHQLKADCAVRRLTCATAECLKRNLDGVPFIIEQNSEGFWEIAELRLVMSGVWKQKALEIQQQFA